MALLKAETKRAIASAIARASTVAGLLAGFQSFQDSAFVAVKSGKFLASSSGAGHSAMFAMIASMPPDEILGFSQELIEGFTAAQNTLIAEGTPTPTDAAILARMLLADNFTAVTRTYSDFTGIRFATSGGAI